MARVNLNNMAIKCRTAFFFYMTLIKHLMNLLKTVPPKKLRIACLHYRGLSSDGIEAALLYMFPKAEVVSIYPQHIRQHALKNYDILILPGINDEDSAYPTLLPTHKMQILKDTIEQNGLILWTFCASSYYMFEEISYQKRSGIMKSRQGAGFIKGAAVHGFKHITRQRLNASPWNDYILAGIHVEGHNELLRALNINGPTFLVDKSERKLVNQFMKYKDIEGAAGVIKNMGRGMLIALGVHPELSPIHKKLPDSFLSYDIDRWTILGDIRERICRHLIATMPSHDLRLLLQHGV